MDGDKSEMPDDGDADGDLDGDADGDETETAGDGDLDLQGDDDKAIEDGDVPDGDIVDIDEQDNPLDGDLSDGDQVSTDGDEDVEPDGDSKDEETPPPIGIRNLYAVENLVNVLSFHVEWTTDAPAATILNVDCSESDDHQFAESGPLTDHHVFVMGLISGETCLFEARSRLDAADEEKAETSVIVGDLPDYLPEFSVDVLNEEKAEPGWTIFNLSNRYTNVPFAVAVLDLQGRYRWYHRRTTNDPGGANAITLIPEGMFISGQKNLMKPGIVSWEGDLLWEENINMHHDGYILETDAGRHLLYLSTEWNVCSGILEDFDTGIVVEYDFASGQVLWSWRLCDHYMPEVAKVNWHHINSINMFPGENTFLLSSRDQDMIFKVDKGSGEIIWKMGSAGDFTLAEGEWFEFQHSPEILPNGNILLFDNGRSSRKWSRALELAYDENSKQAEIIWQFRPDPDIHTGAWSDADRLANGNTLVTFGVWSNVNPGHIIEVTHSKEVVWDLRFAVTWGVYRSERMDPKYGYVLTE